MLRVPAHLNSAARVAAVCGGGGSHSSGLSNHQMEQIFMLVDVLWILLYDCVSTGYVMRSLLMSWITCQHAGGIGRVVRLYYIRTTTCYMLYGTIWCIRMQLTLNTHACSVEMSTRGFQCTN